MNALGTLLMLACVQPHLMRQARAESVRYIDLQGFARLLEGDAQTTALSEDGAILLPPQIEERFQDASINLGTACLWRDDVVAAQTGEDARVLAIDRKGQTRTLLPNLSGRVVTRMAVHKGALVVATAPKPELVLLQPAGKTETISVPDVGFVWDMVSAADGSLIVATGEPGRIMKLAQGGAWSTVFEADEAHIKALAYDPQVGLFAGGGQRGIVYHGSTGGPMRALYDSGNTEVTALTLDGNVLYAATVSGAQAAVAPKGDDAPQAKPEVRSSVARIGLDGTSELLAGSADEIVFDVLTERPGSVILATGAVGRKDARGRLYRLDTAKRSIALLHQSQARRLTQLLRQPAGSMLAVGQDSSRITAFSKAHRQKGCYLSPTLDTGITSVFGAVQALGSFPRGTGATLSVRTGQTSEPDNSWSAWSPETDAQAATASHVPPGRYAQLRLQLRSSKDAQPEVLRLRLSYLRQNIAPFVRDIAVLDKGLAWAALPQNQDDSRQKLVVLNDRSPEEPNADAGRKPQQRARQTQERGALTVRWLVDDANGDDLHYTLWMRPLAGAFGTSTNPWKLLADHITEPFYVLQSAQLADGHYLFRVRASDAPSNPTHLARQDERTSRPFLIDNTPPEFKDVRVTVKNHRAKLSGTLSDASGLLVSLQMALDGAKLTPWAPADGVLDGPKESLNGDLGYVASGSHTLTLVAQDEAQNEAYTTVTFTVPLGS